VVATVIFVVAGLALALLVQNTRPGVGFFRTAFLLPAAVGLASSSLLFYALYNNDFGPLDDILRGLGLIQGQADFLGTPDNAFASTVVMVTWRFAGFNIAFFPMHITGLFGMRRRVFTFLPDPVLDRLNLTITIGAIVLGVGILVTLINVVRSLRTGTLAGANPWRADTLEWDMPSPPPSYGAATVPDIVSLHPLWDAHDESNDPSGERSLDAARIAMATTWRQAQPAGLSTMPEDTAAPLLLAIAITVVVSALLLKALWIAGFGLVLCLALTGYWLWPEPRKVPA
jgi:hypothetical protein